jgi:hypothetical protein
MNDDRKLKKTSSSKSDCPMCDGKGLNNGPSIVVKTWNKKMHRYDHGYFHRWVCQGCGYKWLT